MKASTWQRYGTTTAVAATHGPVPLLAGGHYRAGALVNEGMGLETSRRRLGHKHLQTTLRYAEQADAVGDAEIRGWRRRRGAGR